MKESAKTRSEKSYKDYWKTTKDIEEGNEFGAARAEAIAKGKKTFKVGGKEYPVEDVSKDDVKNAQDFVNENIEEYDVENYDDLMEFTNFLKNMKEGLNEAEYKGRTVKLNKPMRGDVKKFKVYVNNDKGNVVKVNFGHGGTSAKRKTMRIRKSNPSAKKSFRARHNCSSPGPRTGARYWSCKAWE
tara:strand:+ start:2505 stop:3062 length:558 start_codon:yes stop_codon:yes gene_type:complete